VAGVGRRFVTGYDGSGYDGAGYEGAGYDGTRRARGLGGCAVRMADGGLPFR